MLALWITLGSLGYLTLGRAYGKLTWNTWTKRKRTSLPARLLFPLSSEDGHWYGRFGRSQAQPWYHPLMARDVSGGEDDMRGHLAFASLFWPIFLTVNFFNLTLKWPIRFTGYVLDLAVIRLPAAFMNAPSKLLPAMKSFIFEEEDEAPKALPPAAEPVLTTEATSPEREYLLVVRRRQELLAEMDALALKEADIVTKLGGPDEAKKLAALPGKII